jgi:uncharacterized membrane protein (UPF0136 family)
MPRIHLLKGSWAGMCMTYAAHLLKMGQFHGLNLVQAALPANHRRFLNACIKPISFPFSDSSSKHDNLLVFNKL